MAEIASKRLTPYRIIVDISGDQSNRQWVVPKLAYEANADITVANEQVRRVIVSLHGNGGDAIAYHGNGQAIVATRSAVAPEVTNETFVIAPQFFTPTEVNVPIDDDLLYWESARAYANNSGDVSNAPRSFQIRSFDVMDELLTQLCQPEVFPNLKVIVLVGQSNGGQFVSRYAATNPFEGRIARPRGIHVRYVAMGAGTYLYMDGERYSFADESYKNAAADESWRSSIVQLSDFNSVCSVNEDRYNWWWHGLDHLTWNYPKQFGADVIREQFGRRDVVYLVGENDLSQSGPECPDRVQGPDTLAKTLLYYYHLEQFYGAELRHRIRVVAGVGHSGIGTMNSPEGIEEIFREHTMPEYTTVYGKITRLQVEQVGSDAQLRCTLGALEGNTDHTHFFAYLDRDDALIVSRQLDLMREAFIHRLRVRLRYDADAARGSWKPFYDVRVYRDS